MSVDIKHYLKTFTEKPGALRNSLALKSNPRLKSIYDIYYSTEPKKFIEIIKKNKEKKIEEIEEILIKEKNEKETDVKIANKINDLTRLQTSMYNKLSIGVDEI